MTLFTLHETIRYQSMHEIIQTSKDLKRFMQKWQQWLDHLALRSMNDSGQPY